MDILLEVYHDDKVDYKITKHNIKAFLLAVKWAIAELINHPDVFSKVREEIEFVVGRSRLVEESDIPNLPYLQAVVKESLRMHPPAPLLMLYAMMRDPDLWEKPNEFQPERRKKKLPGFTLIICLDEYCNCCMSLSLPQQLLCRPVVHFNPFA
ncbi:hypothetical protein Pint_24057 [Pistacia integerrima]|uniref:Uncharacterized protein n=1 Tax=Pistacia integerrima TaxID=434235 RepID=A0ACC0YKN0_9ROSI|nr:hypothetical protein Pint_24057 [Pistacia integerrima]